MRKPSCKSEILKKYIAYEKIKTIMGQNVLITGGEGFVGGHLKSLLPSSQTYDLKNNQDILNWNQLVESLKGIDTVVHLAALISVNDSITHPGKYYSVNIAGTDNVIRAAIEAGCKTIIFASSAAVYTADNPYGLSKKIGESLMEEYKDKIQTISLRFFNIYGPKQNPEYAGVISKFFEFAKNKQPLKVTGDGLQTRDFISVADITKIITKIIEKRETIPSGSVYELGTSHSISINDLAKIFADKYSLPINHMSGESVGIVHSVSNNGTLLQAIGDYQFKPLDQGLEELSKTLI